MSLSPEIETLLALAEAMITFRESDQGVSWDEFLHEQHKQHEAMRSAISAVRNADQPAGTRQQELFADT